MREGKALRWWFVSASDGDTMIFFGGGHVFRAPGEAGAIQGVQIPCG